MMIRYYDCHFEDFPCCGHYDSSEYTMDEADYADYLSDLDDDSDDWDDDEDAAALRGVANRQRVNAFGQRLRDDAPVFDTDSHLDDYQHEEF